ncbi:carbonyl reductase [NADPH] 3-like [Cimex lectularius]|uniref:carbonyl reductase (NADPH) n=1 Tax=Cimex lectularius TaxID=79782 RepID=A0A8I6RET2_CIMLE|nr:carbonyl reductase [NADPH] 3-like [Cimex lectularius]
MSSKVAVVTGSNKGIGFGIVRNLCKQFDGVVYLTSRDVGRGQAAVEELKKAGLKPPEYHQLDILDLDSIRKFGDHLKTKHGGIDVLVNNAAIAFKAAATEPFAEQAEVTLRTNYFALVDVCNELFPLLKPHARVVNVSSSAGHLLRIPGEELRKKFSEPNLTEPELSKLMKQFIADAKDGSYASKGWPNSTYVVSKVGVSTLTRIQHRLFLEDPREDIVINHVHPGYVDTDMTSHQGPLTIEQGADAPTYLALLPKGTTSPKGDYVWYTREICDWVNGPTPSVV